jgi:hypothetical protein
MIVTKGFDSENIKNDVIIDYRSIDQDLYKTVREYPHTQTTIK